MTKQTIIDRIQTQTTGVKRIDPNERAPSSSNIKLDFLTDDWTCELVQPSHPALRKSATIDPFTGDIDWAAREEEMIALMHSNIGVGLAANQIGDLHNMFVMHHSVLGDIGVYKPKLLETPHEVVQLEEGCLTWPLLYLPIKRPERVKVQFYKADGETIVETWMDGMDARCFLHEYDHLQGIPFIQIASDLKLKRAQEKRNKRFKKLSKVLKKKKR